MVGIAKMICKKYMQKGQQIGILRDGEAEQLINSVRRVILLEQALFEFLGARAGSEMEGGITDVDVILHRKGKGKVIDLERAIQ